MEWRSSLAAIRIPSGETSVHIAERPFIKQEIPIRRFSGMETFCGISLVDPCYECNEADIDCEDCKSEVERQQAYWKAFWSSPKGIKVIKILTGFDKIEKEWRENHRRTEAFIREMEEFNKMVADCLKHTQPVFTLELPDDVLLKLVSYGSAGEVLLAFKMSEETRKSLQTDLGKEGFALLGSRLISKGLLKANDLIFNRKW